MKRVLIVSDNAELTGFFQKEVDRQELEDGATFDYAYSVTNHHPEPMLSLGATAIDVTDPASCQRAAAEYDLVISIHSKQIFRAELVDSVRCVNLHPGLNPHNRGWYPQVFSILNNKPVGATLHVMDAEIDHGPIVAQEAITVESTDTSLEVYTRILESEKRLLKTHLKDLVANTLEARSMDSEGNYNSIDDFRALCTLEMDSVDTLRNHIDLLRALTHGDWDNAHFTDESGDKVFVRISLHKSD